ncbi:unnamed protein product, partial [Prorocentrum cordatum]
ARGSGGAAARPRRRGQRPAAPRQPQPRDGEAETEGAGAPRTRGPRPLALRRGRLRARPASAAAPPRPSSARPAACPCPPSCWAWRAWRCRWRGVAAVPYGLGLLLRTPVLREGVLRPLAPLIRAYHGSRYGSYAGIVGLYALARQRSVHPFVRTVGMQASTLMMMQFPVGFLMQFFAAAPRPLFNLLNTSVFAFYAWCVFLGALGCLSGRTVRMPLIGDGSLPSGGFYRGMRGGMRGGMGGMRPPFGGGGG